MTNSDHEAGRIYREMGLPAIPEFNLDPQDIDDPTYLDELIATYLNSGGSVKEVMFQILLGQELSDADWARVEARVKAHFATRENT